MTTGINKKRTTIRAALLALIILLCFALYYTGKEHEVLLDNKSVTIDGAEYEEIEYMSVTVDGDEKKSMEFYAGDRDLAKVKGPSHAIKVTVLNEDTEEEIKTAEYKFSLGTRPVVMFSLPAIAGGAQNPELPTPQAEAPEPEEDEEETPSEEAPPL